MSSPANRTIRCHACDSRTDAPVHRAPFCRRCWIVVPAETKAAYERGDLAISRMVEVIKLRRTSLKTLGGGTSRRRG